MSIPDYGNAVAKLVQTFDGRKGESRGTVKHVIKDSTTLYFGQVVSVFTGTDTAPSGAEFGVVGYTATTAIYGIVMGITKFGKTLPIQDDSARAGTLTDATNSSGLIVPWKYLTSSANDESHTTTAALELVEIMPIVWGDIVEFPLINSGATALVVRGTTTAAGTTGSSDNFGVGLTVNSTMPWALTESSATKTLTNVDFMTTTINGLKPKNPYHVYAMNLRGGFRRAMA